MNVAGNLDKKLDETHTDAASNVVSLTVGAIHNALSGFGKHFHAFVGALVGTIKWINILNFFGGAAFIVI